MTVTCNELMGIIASVGDKMGIVYAKFPYISRKQAAVITGTSAIVGYVFWRKVGLAIGGVAAVLLTRMATKPSLRLVGDIVLYDLTPRQKGELWESLAKKIPEINDMDYHPFLLCLMNNSWLLNTLMLESKRIISILLEPWGRFRFSCLDTLSNANLSMEANTIVQSKSAVRLRHLESRIMEMVRVKTAVCCVCKERRMNVLFLCGHRACSTCADYLYRCHLCQCSGGLQRGSLYVMCDN